MIFRRVSWSSMFAVPWLILSWTARRVGASLTAAISMLLGLPIARQRDGRQGTYVVLTEEGAGFFRQHCACRAGDKLMFSHADGLRPDYPRE
jgi:hypothetical protein